MSKFTIRAVSRASIQSQFFKYDVVAGNHFRLLNQFFELRFSHKLVVAQRFKLNRALTAKASSRCITVPTVRSGGTTGLLD
jgi:hypothetical protein